MDPSGRLERVRHCGWTILGVTAHCPVCGSGHEDSPELGEKELCRVVKLGALYTRIVGIAGIKINSHYCVVYLIPDELITAVIYLGYIVWLFFFAHYCSRELIHFYIGLIVAHPGLCIIMAIVYLNVV